MDEKENADGKEELRKFYQPLVDLTQYTISRHFITGSSVEMPGNEISLKFLASINESDVLDDDYMFYSTLAYAFPLGRPVPDSYTGDVFRIVTDTNTHPGYVKLLNEIDSTRLDISKYTDVIVPEGHSVVDSEHGPAVIVNTRSDLNSVTKRYVKAESLEGGLVRSVAGIFAEVNDWVRAVHCPYWPDEASEWITRRRSNGSPSKRTIKRVIEYGYDFVQVAHKLSPEARREDANEWRFSFSKAEVIIIRSWTRQQRIHYRILWLTLKKIRAKNENVSSLCTFYFKTLMLWACENKPSTFWSDNLITDSVCQLIYEMIEWLSIRFIPNYFIPDNNMMDHLTNTDVSKDINALANEISSVSLLHQGINASMIAESVNMDPIHRVVVPSWLSRTLIIFKRLHNIIDNFEELFCDRNSSALQNALNGEFEDIRAGVKWQMKAVMCNDETEKEEFVFKSEVFLTTATSLMDSTDMSTIEDDCNSYYIGQHLLSSFFQLVSQEMLANDIFIAKRNHHFLELPAKCEPNGESDEYSRNITAYVIFDNNPIVEVSHFKDWPGTSPTVNITWFLAKMYLANLFYTLRNDYDLTISVCNEVLATYNKTKYNQFFAERTFPFILSTRYTAIYDNEIQALLGFHALSAYELVKSNARYAVSKQIANLKCKTNHSTSICRQASNKNEQAILGFYSICLYVRVKAALLSDIKGSGYVYIGVCPVQFALYLKCRCISHQFEEGQYIEWKDRDCVQKFQEHWPTEYRQIECMSAYDSKIYCGWWLVSHAMKNFGKRMLTLRDLRTYSNLF